MSKCATWPVSLRGTNQWKETSKKHQNERLRASKRLGDGYVSQKNIWQCNINLYDLGEVSQEIGRKHKNNKLLKQILQLQVFYHGFFKLLIWSCFLQWQITLLGARYPRNKMQITRPGCTASRQMCHSWSLWVAPPCTTRDPRFSIKTKGSSHNTQMVKRLL